MPSQFERNAVGFAVLIGRECDLICCFHGQKCGPVLGDNAGSLAVPIASSVVGVLFCFVSFFREKVRFALLFAWE